mgnify:CR=1 FL=1
MSHPLDRTVWNALHTRQRGLAVGDPAHAVRYQPEYGMFAATVGDSPEALQALAALVTPDGVAQVEAELGPLPPGCMQTVWRDDERFVKTYWSSIPGRQIYSTFDWGIRDADGYYFILGRTDDVINVAGHRLGTREIEEAVQSHAAVAEVAVVGVADQLKGQMPLAFAVVKDPARVATAEARAALEKEVMATVDGQLGAIARPSRVHFVSLLPKTRSGKLLRRSIQALAEGRDPGDLTTLEDAGALEQIRQAIAG